MGKGKKRVNFFLSSTNVMGFFKIKFLCNYNSEYFTFVIPKYLVMAFLSSWLTVNRYRRFSYTPRYYDARRERREEFVRQLEKGEQYGSGVITGNSFRIQRGFLHTMRNKHHKENNASFIRLVFILFALIVIFYLLLR
jgi:hypothetical protein